ncbi:antitoxin family protein [Thermococcus litoralis]
MIEAVYENGAFKPLR